MQGYPGMKIKLAELEILKKKQFSICQVCEWVLLIIDYIS